MPRDKKDETPTPQCLTRLMKEQRKLIEKPSALFAAGPEPENILRWYFVVDGPADTDYAGGRYLGQLKFPPEYPFKPPDILMHTPNGRFNTDTPLCLSNSSFHPEEWSPMWGVETIVTGFISFMVANDMAGGSIKRPPALRRQLAKESRAFNVMQLRNVYEKVLPAEYAKDLEIVEREKCSGDGSNNSNNSNSEAAATGPAPPQVSSANRQRGKGTRGGKNKRANDVASVAAAAAAGAPNTTAADVSPSAATAVTAAIATAASASDTNASTTDATGATGNKTPEAHKVTREEIVIDDDSLVEETTPAKKRQRLE